MIFARLAGSDPLCTSGEDQHGRAGRYDLAATFDPARVLDLRLLRKIDLFAERFLAQDGAVDDRNDVAAERLDEREVFAIRIRELDKEAHRILSTQPLPDRTLDCLRMTRLRCLADAAGIDRAQEIKAIGAARVDGGQNKTQACRVAGNVAPVRELGIARNRIKALAHIVVTDNGEGRLRAQLLDQQSKGVELGIAELARIGAHPLDRLARSARRRAGEVELSQFEFVRQYRTEMPLIGSIRGARVDPISAGRRADKGEGNERGGVGEAGLHAFLLQKSARGGPARPKRAGGRVCPRKREPWRNLARGGDVTKISLPATGPPEPARKTLAPDGVAPSCSGVPRMQGRADLRARRRKAVPGRRRQCGPREEIKGRPRLDARPNQFWRPVPSEASSGACSRLPR